MIADRAKAKPKFDKIVMGAADRGGKRFFMDLDIHPRRHLMQRALTNFVLPVLAVAMIATVIVFPSPQALDVAVREVTSPFQPSSMVQSKGTTDAAFIVEDHAVAVPGLTSQLEANADCFVGLDAASPARLEECAPAVTQIIAQIVAYQDNPQVAQALSEQDGKLLPQIKLAATEVCRSLWATGKDAMAYLDDPACRMAEVSLATYTSFR